MTFEFAVTYEFDEQPPLTKRGIVDCETEEQCLTSISIEQQGIAWRSLVVLLTRRETKEIPTQNQ